MIYDVKKLSQTRLSCRVPITVESRLDAVAHELDGHNIFVVTDTNIASKYQSLLAFDKPKYIISAGEAAKTLDTAGAIAKAMLEAGCDRKTRLIALGGGIVGDVGGFVAACYMRGIEWTSIPTTLLAQADSGIGGKTAVNVGGFKNMFGAFCMPSSIIVSTRFLTTLSDKEWLSGTGEIVKTGLLDKELWELVYGSRLLLAQKDTDLYKRLITKCIAIKDSVTAADFKEKGLRKVLNAGHTLGHALESIDGYKLSHGEYVLWGIKHETDYFAGDIEPKLLKQLREVLDILLMGRADPYNNHEPHKIKKAAQADKKNENNKTAYMIPIKAGIVAQKQA